MTTDTHTSTVSLVDLSQFSGSLLKHAREARRRGVELELIVGDFRHRWVSLPTRTFALLVGTLVNHAIDACLSGRVVLVFEQLPPDDGMLLCQLRLIDAAASLPTEQATHLGAWQSRETLTPHDLPTPLHAVAALAESVGGRLTYSQSRQGATVLALAVPCHAAGVTGAAPQDDRRAAAAPRLLKKLLLVEDDPINSFVESEQLTRMGFDVAIAGDGAEALSLLEAKSFDFVLTDCEMPVMNGFEFTRTLRAREAAHGGHLVIIALTVDQSEQSRQDCLACGMDGWLTKPIQPHKLQEIFEDMNLLPAQRS